jgi:Cu/Ag efflux protein CusF
MKTLKYLLVAAAAVPALAGPGYAQTPKPATPPAAAAEDAAKTAPKSLMGEFVAADQAAKTVTVKHMVDKKPMQLTFSVEDGALSTLTQLKPGDHVKVTYVEMGEKRIIKSIVKA